MLWPIVLAVHAASFSARLHLYYTLYMACPTLTNNGHGEVRVAGLAVFARILTRMKCLVLLFLLFVGVECQSDTLNEENVVRQGVDTFTSKLILQDIRKVIIRHTFQLT